MNASNPTIAAISTPMGTGGIAVIRISGPEAIEIAGRVFRSPKSKKLSDLKGYTALYGHIFDKDRLVDEAVALVFRAPNSYTGEDVVELSVHGGVFVAKSALRAVLSAGASLAGPGEFTRRAFENGKLDLTQAEAVMQLISAAGEQELKASLSAREGKVSQKIDELTNKLLYYAAELAAYSDYPDEDIPELEAGSFTQGLLSVKEGLQRLLSTYDAGRILREGIDTAIVGRPNVGKSTLMNLLSGCQRSIVTPIPGTTRDVVEETVVLGSVKLRLADTAGLRESEDIVEKIGVERTRQRLESAELILAVFDASEALNRQDLELINECKRRPSVAIINKTDLPNKLGRHPFEEAGITVVEISAKTGSGLEELIKAVEQVTGIAKLDTSSAILGSERQRACADRALKHLIDAIDTINMGFTLDAVGVCIDSALAELYSLTGKRVTNEVVDEVFRRFCVGK
ncbi:MAG TPA: tRNA uridine-5-carboxymethylaminomethyl(34) synthesis GTPase MnmE [Clostridiales bacterium]|nr:tRNA uridine-5-carboxymethylaminomethyl(34) synthesis GTPase MnmE [Clostridiales bacterium]